MTRNSTTTRLAAKLLELSAELETQAQDLQIAAYDNSYTAAELAEALSLVLDTLDMLRLEYAAVA